MNMSMILSEDLGYQIKRIAHRRAHRSVFRLKLRKDVDYGILSVAMTVVRTSSKMGVDHRNSAYNMRM